MAMMLDLHSSLALQTQIAAFAASVASFRALFGGMVPTAALDAWHGELFPSGSVEHLRVQQAYDSSKPRTTQITLKLSNEGASEIPLGYGGETEGEVEMLVTQTVALTCHAPNHEVLVALDTAVCGAMMASFAWFERAGYLNLQYLGGGDVLPEERMILPDDFGAFARTQRWSAMTRQQALVTAVTKNLPVHVHNEDVTVGGIDGGVTPTP